MILKHLPSNTGILQAHVLVEELVRNGVDTYFISPGSRSTPLVIAVAANPRARAYVHFDERGSAFAALGYARGSGKPAAWITTSGSAVANGFPAVVEAAQDSVPIILLTADRPPELRGVGANQAIDQSKLFGGYTRYYSELVVADSDRALRSTVRIASQAYCSAVADRGPVHVNCQFREPLTPSNGAGSATALTVEDLDDLRSWFTSGLPLTTGVATSTYDSNANIVSGFSEAVSQSVRGLVVIGALSEKADFDAIAVLCEQLGFPVLVDPLSQFRSIGRSVSRQVEHYDQLLAVDRFRDRVRPDVIVHIGGRIISKALVGLIGRNTDARLFRIGNGTGYNPSERTQVFLGDNVGAIIRQLDRSAKQSEDWLRLWNDANGLIVSLCKSEALQGESLIARHVAEAVPSDWNLFIGNSMPIRDVDRFATLVGGSRVFANRGASGIDGNVATSFGISVGGDAPVLALVGDLTLLHDVNSLAMLSRFEHPVILVVVNNDGGGIFSFLPISSFESVFDSFFGTPHGMRFASAAEQFGLKYEHIDGVSGFGAALQAALAVPESRIIEVQSERRENANEHVAFTALVADRLESE